MRPSECGPLSPPTLAELPALARPPHIVCIHGGGACAAVLRVQLSRLLMQLGPLGADVSYIEGGRVTEFDQCVASASRTRRSARRLAERAAANHAFAGL